MNDLKTLQQRVERLEEKIHLQNIKKKSQKSLKERILNLQQKCNQFDSFRIKNLMKCILKN